jgi:hypothetical protein
MPAVAVINDLGTVANPEIRAVRMVLDVRAALGAVLGKWRRFGHDLGFGIGISHCLARLGTTGFEARFSRATLSVFKLPIIGISSPNYPPNSYQTPTRK